ncbi:MAG: hypothetical protein PHI34_03415 [Acidobacteriota bacterium]|nr:hypothetical protein [Acidobacteriota bacterium]
MRRRRRMEYEAALRLIRGWAADAAETGWTDEEWKDLVRRAARQAPAPPSRARMPLWRPAIAAAAMLAALIGGAWYLAHGPAAPASFVPDSRAGEMLPADPGALVAPERSAFPAGATTRNPLLTCPPENPPAWLYLGPGPGSTIFFFTPPAISR